MNALSKLAEGSTSIAYLYENNNKKYVMCVPTKKNWHMSQWLRHARRYATVTQSISRRLKVNYAVARLIRNNNAWELHTNYLLGKNLTYNFFTSLSSEIQEKILTDLAELYLSLHELSLKYTDEHYATQVVGKNNKLYVCIGMIRHFIAKHKKTYLSTSQRSDKRKLLKNIEKIKTTIQTNPAFINERYQIIKILDKITTHPDTFKYYGAYHSDMHAANLFFNEDSKTIGVIDFGGSTYRKNIYLELGFMAVPNNFGFSFVSRLAEKINQLCADKTYHWKNFLSIDIELLKSFAAYAILKEKKYSEEFIKKWLNEI